MMGPSLGCLGIVPPSLQWGIIKGGENTHLRTAEAWSRLLNMWDIQGWGEMLISLPPLNMGDIQGMGIFAWPRFGPAFSTWGKFKGGENTHLPTAGVWSRLLKWRKFRRDEILIFLLLQCLGMVPHKRRLVDPN